MNCPSCGGDITRLIRKAIKAAAKSTGSKGGSTKGATKRRDVDYSALARKGAEARKALKAISNR